MCSPLSLPGPLCRPLRDRPEAPSVNPITSASEYCKRFQNRSQGGKSGEFFVLQQCPRLSAACLRSSGAQECIAVAGPSGLRRPGWYALTRVNMSVRRILGFRYGNGLRMRKRSCATGMTVALDSLRVACPKGLRKGLLGGDRIRSPTSRPRRERPRMRKDPPGYRMPIPGQRGWRVAGGGCRVRGPCPVAPNSGTIRG